MVPAFFPRSRSALPMRAAVLAALLTAAATFAQEPASPLNDVPPRPAAEGTPAPPDKDKAVGKDTSPWWSAHGQATVVSQGNWKFHSPYEGPVSLRPILNYRTTATATLYLDARPWEGGEVIFNPEVSGGRGLSDTMGLGGFPNGEATRVGVVAPTPYVARLLFRQTFALDGDPEKVEDGANVIAGIRDIDRVSVSVGKMSSTDIFDDNRFSHDPRTQFLNWSLMFDGAWDYPANVRGYTYGATVDFNTRFLAVRYGVFGEPTVANGTEIDPRFLKANGHALEFEGRYELGDDHPGKVRLLSYLNHAHMGKYRDALALRPVNPDVTLTRAYRIKYGFGLNVEQELTRDLGLFARLGWNDGGTETWAFTEIDETAALGLLLRGRRWRRPKDQVGLALVVNGLSDPHRDYLAAGGVGFIVGDGRLRYGLEKILETYYNWEVRENINVSADFQAVDNPAYNRDRGPVAIFAIRLHFAY